jgi:antitoxin PrlF
MIAAVTSKGQGSLPAEVRRLLKIFPGSKLEFTVIDEERLEVVPVAKTVTRLKGMVPKPKKVLSLEGMGKAIARGASY